MLSGVELGRALRVAMQKKGVVQREVATEFGIKQPSVSEWLRYGRISKEHITHLVRFFGDVLPPSHWGLPDDWGTVGLVAGGFSPRAMRLARLYDEAPAHIQRIIYATVVASAGEAGAISAGASDAGEPATPPAAPKQLRVPRS